MLAIYLVRCDLPAKNPDGKEKELCRWMTKANIGMICVIQLVLH